MPLVPVPNAALDVCLWPWGVPFDILRCSRKARCALLHWTITQQAMLQTKCKLGCHLGRGLRELMSRWTQRRPVLNICKFIYIRLWDIRNSHMVSCQLTHAGSVLFLYYFRWVISFEVVLWLLLNDHSCRWYRRNIKHVGAVPVKERIEKYIGFPFWLIWIRKCMTKNDK